MKAAHASALTALLLLAPAAASAEEPLVRKDHAVSVSASGLATFMTTSRGDTSGTISERNGGNAIAGRISYRSPYVLGAFADVGYFPIYRRDRQIDLGAASGITTTRAALSTTSFVVGLSADVWRLRASAGLGWNELMVTTTTLGQTSRTNELDLGYMVSLAAYPVRWSRLEVGVEARALFVAEAEVSVFCFGLTLGGDAVRF